jgi:TonB family protein
MRCSTVLVFSLYWGLIMAAPAQESTAEGHRKIVRQAIPTYPQMAKRMNISGTVKVFALVAPDGTVKTTEPVGGSPLLIQASEEAIKKWKFAPAAAESKELIELHFTPQEGNANVAAIDGGSFGPPNFMN